MNNNNKLKKEKTLIFIRILIYGLLLFLISLCVYSNSLEGEFCFDDQFAIVGNKDVIGYDNINDDGQTKTNVPNTIESLNHFDTDDNGDGNSDQGVSVSKQILVYFKKMLMHDFWGQDITKSDSHKSYRPFTTLSFKLNFLSSGLDAYAFHFTNVFIHSIVSIYIFFLALLVFVPTFSEKNSRALELLKDTQQKSMLYYLLSVLGVDEFCCFLSALLFALHPIHTEAVSGIVGRAELLSTMFLVLSLLAYFKCYSPRTNRTNWKFFILSLVFLLLSTLSKETGFTLVLILPITDILLIQYPYNKVYFTNKEDINNRTRYRLPPILPQNKRQWISLLERVFFIGLFACAFLYFRKIITVDMILDNFRNLENPIARESDISVRFLSLANLHARYLWLLIFPNQLSADWSFNCIPLIKSVFDPINLLSVLAYSSVFILVLVCLKKIQFFFAIKQLLLFIFSKKRNNKNQQKNYNDDDDEKVDQDSTTDKDKACRPEYYHSILWCLLFGLISFLPSSNIFFYVGTAIGERLLYIPSIAFCLLLSRFLTLPLIYLSDYQINNIKEQTKENKNNKSTIKPQSTQSTLTTKKRTTTITPTTTSTPTSNITTTPNDTLTNIEYNDTFKIKKLKGYNNYLLLLIIIVLIISSLYSVKTWFRNEEWKNEESLFMSALSVCPNSAKVHYNVGILYRRTKQWDKSLEHFERAKEILPEYCDVDYFYALTLINKYGDYEKARPYLMKSMGCRYSQAKALEAINEIMNFMMQSNSNNPKLYSDWGFYEQDLQPVSSATHYHKAGLLYNEMGQKEKAIEHFNLALKNLAKVNDSMLNPLKIEQEKHILNEIYCQANIWLSAVYFETDHPSKSIDSLELVYQYCKDFKRIWDEGLLSLVNLKMLKIKDDPTNTVPSLEEIYKLHEQMSHINDETYQDGSLQLLTSYGRTYENIDSQKAIQLYQKLLKVQPNTSSYYHQLALLRLTIINRNLAKDFTFYFNQLNYDLIQDDQLKKLYRDIKKSIN
ncbi:hypothetical protein DICPUDRAFT_53154 [Dictyostelium purpureum]|uniref:dolichyl-phosphate-mannose--protein mannosyltransferase n=1 Tax=Dictyostelium purpureum TaxID=5786 RepID=F0ZBE5_DICPU|nr:uncharacterized protein DICPUDRAFT_53154 [Dictyostelium purpureum]EGC38732.1 hypothetical protein DICPUDRAFT_53154 [Dictyostelium purpureum]|eukprot:XP_003284723.1 hypothetical protein DICPUDRAFT_53154 [Dictyostelium purpureum]